MPTKLKHSRSQYNGFGHRFEHVSHCNNPVLIPNQRYCETIHEVSSNECFGDKDGFSFEELRWRSFQSPKKDSRELDPVTWTSMLKTNRNSVQNVCCSVVRNNSDTKLTEHRPKCLDYINTSTTQRLAQLWTNSPLPKPRSPITEDKLFTPSLESKEDNAKQFPPIILREVKKRSILTVNEPSGLPLEQPATLFTNRTWFLTENISNQFGFQPTFYGVAPVFEEGNFYAELFHYPTVPPKTKPVNLRTKKNFKQLFSPYSRNRKNVFY